MIQQKQNNCIAFFIQIFLLELLSKMALSLNFLKFIHLNFINSFLYQINQKVSMRRNTLFHHQKYQQKSTNRSIKQKESKEFSLENPQSFAKFTLLQISQEPLKNNNRSFNYPQNQHSRSYSTQFFNNKSIVRNSNLESGQIRNNGVKQWTKQQVQQSVTVKSTFSNEMRKTIHPFSSHKAKDSSISSIVVEQNQKKKIQSRKESPKKVRQINYLPLMVEQENKVENIDSIFQTAPSKQILAILKKTKLTREMRDYEKISKEKSEDLTNGRKKSIFNIRHLMLKQKNQGEISNPGNEFTTKKVEIKNCQETKQMHSTNKSVIKMRLKNRYNKSSLSKR